MAELNDEIREALAKIDSRRGLNVRTVRDMENIINQDDSCSVGTMLRRPFAVVGLYGVGAHNLVLKIETADQKVYAARFGLYTPNLPEQIRVQETLAEYQMAPKIYTFCRLSKEYYMLIMDPIHDILCNVVAKKLTDRQQDSVARALECLLNKKFFLSLLHGDMHCGNIAVLRDKKTLGFIDFDFVVENVRPAIYNILDFIPLMGSLLEIKGTERILRALHNYYLKTFNVNLNLARFQRRKTGGGFEYKTLNSYLAVIKARPQVRRVLPTIEVPQIVDRRPRSKK